MLLANDVLVDVLPMVPRNLLSVLNNLLLYIRLALHNCFHIPVSWFGFLLQRQCIYLQLLSN